MIVKTRVNVESKWVHAMLANWLIQIPFSFSQLKC
uniref:Uncharacterized protein n=1 Tax=Rhizophora mucronata TaxID=61149 RepID=A0A2P2PD52_RHIMU